MLGDGSRRNLFELTYSELIGEGATISLNHRNVLTLRSFKVCFCDGCLKLNPESYMLHNELWSQVSGGRVQCFLCLKCVEERLQRNLSIDDFTNAIINKEIRFGFRMGRAYTGE